MRHTSRARAAGRLRLLESPSQKVGKTLLLALVVSLTSISCGEDDSEGKDGTLLDGGTQCACEEGICDEGICVLSITLEDACATVTEADVYINADANDPVPVGRIAAGETYTTCEGFAAPTFENEGESFRFYLSTPDGRLISNTVNTDFSCVASAPFEFRVDLCP